jgi:hypothetical protein
VLKEMLLFGCCARLPDAIETLDLRIAYRSLQSLTHHWEHQALVFVEGHTNRIIPGISKMRCL